MSSFTTAYAALMATLLCATWVQPVLAAAPLDSPGAISTVQGTPQRQAAERGLSELSNRLMALPSPGTHIFAVQDYQQLRNARIGQGFEVYLIDPQALLSGQSIRASAYASHEWRFVVTVENRPVGLITVAPVHGQWKMVSAGASEIAAEIAQVTAHYGSQAQLRFLRSQQGVADLIEVSAAGSDRAPRYVPLLSARVMLKQASMAQPASAALEEAQLVPDLRAGIQRGLQTPSLAH
jgi:hypothetical protein